MGLVGQAHPHEAVALLTEVPGEPSTARDVRAETRRDLRADPIGAVGPTVVRAAELVSLDGAERQGRPTMHAEVPETADRSPEPSQDEPLVEERHGNGPLDDVRGIGDGVPEPPEGSVELFLPGCIQTRSRPRGRAGQDRRSRSVAPWASATGASSHERSVTGHATRGADGSAPSKLVTSGIARGFAPSDRRPCRARHPRPRISSVRKGPAMVSSAGNTVRFGTPERGAVKQKGAPGRSCAHADCPTLLSTYNPSATCWLHTQALTRHPLHRG